MALRRILYIGILSSMISVFTAAFADRLQLAFSIIGMAVPSVDAALKADRVWHETNAVAVSHDSALQSFMARARAHVRFIAGQFAHGKTPAVC